MDDRRSIIIPVTIRYGLWPGGEYTCIRALAEHGEVGLWLHGQDGRTHDLAPFRYGMFRGGRRR